MFVVVTTGEAPIKSVLFSLKRPGIRHHLLSFSARLQAFPARNPSIGQLGTGLLTLLMATSALAEMPRDLEYAEPLRLERLPLDFFDFPEEELRLKPREGIWLDSTNWVARQRDIQSERVQSLGDWMDRVLSGEAIRTPDNDSYLRLGFATRWEKNSWLDFEPEARFRLDLPTVKDKFRLVVENAPDEFVPLREQNQDRRLTADERSDTETTGALRYLAMLSERWSLSNDVGIRFHWPLNPFWRTRLYANWDLPGPWSMDVEQRFFYFHTDGWGERTEFLFSRWFSDAYYLTLRSDLQWIDQETRFEWTQIGYLDHFINNRSQITYRLGAIGENRPDWRTTSVFVDAAWRYRLYEDWLFAEVIPALEFPREDNFKENPSLTFRIEMFFAGDEYFPYHRRFLRY